MSALSSVLCPFGVAASAHTYAFSDFDDDMMGQSLAIPAGLHEETQLLQLEALQTHERSAMRRTLHGSYVIAHTLGGGNGQAGAGAADRTPGGSLGVMHGTPATGAGGGGTPGARGTPATAGAGARAYSPHATTAHGAGMHFGRGIGSPHGIESGDEDDGEEDMHDDHDDDESEDGF